ncbi:MAG: M23 family metallopeptidase [Rickettsiales bacterium]|nr:M23 family metallopeptidase [Rickettsiales bacterium]
MRNNKKRILVEESSLPEFSLPFKYEDLPAEIDVNNIITSEYGNRIHPTQGIPKYHAGTDFGLPHNTPIYAPCDTTIVRAIQGHSGFGNVVIGNYNGDKKFLFLCAHLDSINVSRDQMVREGDLIGYSGNTGNGKIGYHLHFEIINGYESVTQFGGTKPAWKWIDDEEGQTNYVGLGSNLAKLNPRLAFDHLPESVFPRKVAFASKQVTAEGDERANIYVGNSRDNGYFDGVDARVFHNSKKLTPSISRSSSLSSKVTNATDTYNFPDRDRIGRDRIYDGDLDARLRIGDVLIDDATLRACAISDATGEFSETVWQLENGPHDQSGLVLIGMRVDDEGNESSEGKNLRVTISSAEANEVASTHSVTIMGFDFAYAATNHCCGMKLEEAELEIGDDDISKSVTIAESENNFYRNKAINIADGGIATVRERVSGANSDSLQVQVFNTDLSARSNVSDVTGLSSYHDVPNAICATSNGGFAVAWITGHEDLHRDDDDYVADDDVDLDNALRVRFFSKDGLPLTNKILILEDSYIIGDYLRIKMARLVNGNIVICYERGPSYTSTRYGIYSVVIDQFGQIVRGTTTLAPGTNYRLKGITSFPNGGYAMTCDWNRRVLNNGQWETQLGSYKVGVLANGEIGDIVSIASEGSYIGKSNIIATEESGYLVSWEEQDPDNPNIMNIYARAYDVDDRVTKTRFLIASSDSFSDFKLTKLKNGDFLFSWEENTAYYGIIKGSLYSEDYQLKREAFTVAESPQNSASFVYEINTAQLNNNFVIMWREGKFDRSIGPSSLEIAIKGAIYNSHGVRLDGNVTASQTVKKPCIALGTSGDDEINLSDLPVYGREGKDRFVVTQGESKVQDFVMGKDKLVVRGSEASGTGSRRLLNSDGLYVNATQNGDAAILHFINQDGQKIASVTLDQRNVLDITPQDFESNSNLPLNILAEGIGISGSMEVLSYIEDNAARIPPVQITTARSSGADTVTARMELDDDYGMLAVDLTRDIEDLAMSYNRDLTQLTLSGDLTAVNQAIVNTSFIPYPNINEAVTLTLNVTDGKSVRAVSLRINGIAVNDPPVVRPYLDRYNISSGGNATLAVGNVTDPDNSPAESSLEVFVKDNDDFVLVESDGTNRGSRGYNGFIDDVGNIILGFNAKELSDAELAMKYRVCDPHACSNNASFSLVTGSKYQMGEIAGSPSPAPTIANPSSNNNRNYAAAFTTSLVIGGMSAAVILGILICCYILRRAHNKNAGVDHGEVEMSESGAQAVTDEAPVGESDILSSLDRAEQGASSDVQAIRMPREWHGDQSNPTTEGNESASRLVEIMSARETKRGESIDRDPNQLQTAR